MIDKVIFLMGPTACGKTALATHLMQRFPLEIVSVDSAQVYRGMNIGSGKLNSEDLARFPHRLVDIRDPHEPYSAADFYEDAHREIDDILSKDKVPLLVGGTMLYFKTLLNGLTNLPPADEFVRKKIQARAAQEGWQVLHAQLAAIDPTTAKALHPNDQQRIQRALEVYGLTGKPMSQFREEQSEQSTAWSNNQPLFPYSLLTLITAPRDRADLHRAIEKRFDAMLDTGFVHEVKSLFGRGTLNLDLPAIRSVGYRQMWGFLEGRYEFDEMRQKALAATRQLAKRQLTWLRSWPEADWLWTGEDGSGGVVSLAESKVEAFLMAK